MKKTEMFVIMNELSLKTNVRNFCILILFEKKKNCHNLDRFRSSIDQL